MGYPTKVQLIQRKESQQWYINFPAAIAQGMDFSKGEDVEWTIADRGHLILSRKAVPPTAIALKQRHAPPRVRGADRFAGACLWLSTKLSTRPASPAGPVGQLWSAYHQFVVAGTEPSPTRLVG